jgi:hypothetical protein
MGIDAVVDRTIQREQKFQESETSKRPKADLESISAGASL